MKELIYFDEGALKPIGGPCGYLYNLKQEINRNHDTEIEFIKPSLFTRVKRSIKQLLFSNLYARKKAHARLDDIENGYIEMVRAIENASKVPGKIDFTKYDIVHFHNTFDLYREKNNIEKYKGKVILTSHSPKVSYKELIEDYISVETYKKNRDLFDNLEKADEYAFSRADYIVFPCEGAEEPYYHSWEKYSILRNPDKIRYIPTGIMPVKPKSCREEIRSRYNIPNDAFLISYVGRHSKVKGYDILVDLASDLFRDSNIYVICCGRESAIVAPKCENWIEVGWTNDPYSIVSASDLYFLPNRETYFDIALLETLSIGKVSLISNTGGNKLFLNHEEEGIFLFDNAENALDIIYKIMGTEKEIRQRMESMQRSLFQDYYSVNHFYTNYKDFTYSIC